MKAWRDGDTAMLQTHDSPLGDEGVYHWGRAARLRHQAHFPCVPPLCPWLHSTTLPWSHALCMCLHGLCVSSGAIGKRRQRLTRASNHPANTGSSDPSREPRLPLTPPHSPPHPEMLFNIKPKRIHYMSWRDGSFQRISASFPAPISQKLTMACHFSSEGSDTLSWTLKAHTYT